MILTYACVSLFTKQYKSVPPGCIAGWGGVGENKVCMNATHSHSGEHLVAVKAAWNLGLFFQMRVLKVLLFYNIIRTELLQMTTWSTCAKRCITERAGSPVHPELPGRLPPEQALHLPAAVDQLLRRDPSRLHALPHQVWSTVSRLGRNLRERRQQAPVRIAPTDRHRDWRHHPVPQRRQFRAPGPLVPVFQWVDIRGLTPRNTEWNVWLLERSCQWRI